MVQFPADRPDVAFCFQGNARIKETITAPRINVNEMHKRPYLYEPIIESH
jgi:hypothetical protein